MFMPSRCITTAPPRTKDVCWQWLNLLRRFTSRTVGSATHPSRKNCEGWGTLGVDCAGEIKSSARLSGEVVHVMHDRATDVAEYKPEYCLQNFRCRRTHGIP